jgi:hypothetical protein
VANASCDVAYHGTTALEACQDGINLEGIYPEYVCSAQGAERCPRGIKGGSNQGLAGVIGGFDAQRLRECRHVVVPFEPRTAIFHGVPEDGRVLQDMLLKCARKERLCRASDIRIIRSPGPLTQMVGYHHHPEGYRSRERAPSTAFGEVSQLQEGEQGVLGLGLDDRVQHRLACCDEGFPQPGLLFGNRGSQRVSSIGRETRGVHHRL